MILHPVILPISYQQIVYKGAQHLALQRQIAREALALSAEKSGISLGKLEKDERDAPIPFGGNYWSLAHKPRYVAAVVAKEPIGIDIEEIKPRSEGIFQYVASNKEWQLSNTTPPNSKNSKNAINWMNFFRYWTAKEAALKAIGIGISELKKCRVIAVPDETHILLDYRDRIWTVEHAFVDNHIAAITKNENEVEWHGL